MTKASIQPDFDQIFFEQAEFAADDIFHGFFGRRGGVSKDLYASLNCGPGSGDALENVQENRKIVSDAAGCDPLNLLSLHQIHSAECLVADGPWNSGERPQADAMVTDKPGLALSVLTADCGPVLFRGEKADAAPVAGAAHAGWGGALKGVLEAVIEHMEGLGAKRETIKAVIGPCIGQASYEVRDDFATAFLEEDERAESFFKSARKTGHLMFDLPGYLAFRLARAGIKNVYIKDLDTYFNEEDFFSYRRAVKRRDKCYGRQVSVVMIKA